MFKQSSEVNEKTIIAKYKWKKECDEITRKTNEKTIIIKSH